MIRDRESFQNMVGDGAVKKDLDMVNHYNGAIFVLNEYINIRHVDDFFTEDEA